MKTRLALSFVLFSSLLSTHTALAQWQLGGVAMTKAASQQTFPKIISDGAGGAIVTWTDTRVGPNDIYAQRINASGVSQWTVEGVALCTATGAQSVANIISDGAGGAIVTWQDPRNPTNNDIYAQRVSAAGVVQWAANGVALCAATGDQSYPTICSDGAGGAIVTWYDARVANIDIYAQRVNSAGTPQWTANGVALCTATSVQYNPNIVSDGTGGAIVNWLDTRNGGGADDIYAQRINAAGTVQWTANGVALCNASGLQAAAMSVADGAGGAIVTWHDLRGFDYDIYAQRINGAGIPQWTADGIGLVLVSGDQIYPTICSDGTGGAIIAWLDSKLGAGTQDVYAQRVNSSGTRQWWGHVPICTVVGPQSSELIQSDGAGGAIVSWIDRRNGGPNGQNFYDVFAQRVDAAGVTRWTPDGVTVSGAVGDEVNPTLVADGAGGVIVTWDTYSDVFAQRLDIEEGYWGHPEATVMAVADIPADQGGKVKVNWKASGWDIRHYNTITHYSIWRAVDTVPLSQTSSAAGVVDLSAVGPDFKGPAYRKEPAANGTSRYWEWIGSQDALYSAGYSFSASTRSDSTLGNTSPTYFQVVSHTADPFVFWTSNEKSGRSVDNLAPPAPLFLTAQRTGNYVHLKWNRVRVSDLRDYAVYRKTSAGVTAVPINFLSSAPDTILTDTTPPASAIYYVVTAYDAHANQSVASNEVALQATTGVGTLPPITALTVLQNSPNPFTGITELQIGLPRVSDVSIEVFDVAGRKVSTMEVQHASAGWQKMAFSGRDDAGHSLASGVYFYRVHANGTTVTRKMVIAR